MKTLIVKSILTLTLTSMVGIVLASQGSWPPPTSKKVALQIANSTKEAVEVTATAMGQTAICGLGNSKMLNPGSSIKACAEASGGSNPQLNITLGDACKVVLTSNNSGKVVKITSNPGNCKQIGNQEVII